MGQGSEAAQQAADALRQAANELAQATGFPQGPPLTFPGPGQMVPGQPKPPAPGQPAQIGTDFAQQNPEMVGQSGGGSTGGSEITDVSRERLEELGLSPIEWTKLPGSLKNKILQANGSEAPQEYRAMVRRYFRELARRGIELEQGTNP